MVAACLNRARCVAGCRITAARVLNALVGNQRSQSPGRCLMSQLRCFVHARIEPLLATDAPPAPLRVCTALPEV